MVKPFDVNSDGPWKGEHACAYPGEQFRALGCDCTIIRNGLGSLCGYVRVPDGHPWHGKHYDDIDAKVHGGLTFSGKLRADMDGWWIGFDCAHSGDLVPAMSLTFPGDTYRTFGYVVGACGDLAGQVIDAGKAQQPIDLP
jgi:hypothetical protein